jgi:hypothetical protein
MFRFEKRENLSRPSRLADPLYKMPRLWRFKFQPRGIHPGISKTFRVPLVFLMTWANS